MSATDNYQVIPTTSDPFQSMTVTLDGVSFILTFYYNQRENCYYMSVTQPDGTDLAVGVKCVTSWPLLHKWSTPDLPAGEFLISPNTSDTGPATLGQLGPGLGWTLFYIPVALLP
jgi:hypothetical protein